MQGLFCIFGATDEALPFHPWDVGCVPLSGCCTNACGTFYSCQEAIDQPVIDWDEYHERQTDSIRQSVDEFERSWD